MGLKDRLFKRQDDDSNSNKQDLIHDGDDYINNPKKYDVYIYHIPLKTFRLQMQFAMSWRRTT